MERLKRRIVWALLFVVLLAIWYLFGRAPMQDSPSCESAFLAREGNVIYAYITAVDPIGINSIYVYVNARLFTVCTPDTNQFTCRVRVGRRPGLYRLDAVVYGKKGKSDRCPPFVERFR